MVTLLSHLWLNVTLLLILGKSQVEVLQGRELASW